MLFRRIARGTIKKLKGVARTLYASDAKPEKRSLIARLDELVGQAEKVTECWPDNWLPLRVFAALGTQWNVAYGAYVGLKYEALPVVLDEFGIKKRERAEIIGALRIMEIEALKVMNKRE